MTVIPVTPTTYTEWQKAARFPPCLPAGTGSVEVLYWPCRIGQDGAHRQALSREKGEDCCLLPVHSLWEQ